MSKHIKQFQNESAYNEFRQSQDFELPNLSWCIEENAIKTEAVPPPPPHDYSKDYFTIVSLADNNRIGWKESHTAMSITPATIQVSTNNGETWVSVTSNSGTTGNKLAILNTGDKLLIKGTRSTYAGRYNSGYNVYSNYGNWFTMTGPYNVEGNMMSMLYGDNFIGQTEITKPYTFTEIFDKKLVDASNLILPATALYPYCYFNMFFGCTEMTGAPELPATTLKPYCYNYMFYFCNKLSSIKCLATDISATNCTDDWLRDVSATGTFIKDSSMTNWTTGVNGIPEGWTVEDA